MAKGFGRLPLHNALIKDALDKVEVCIHSNITEKRSYSSWVRFLRWALLKIRNKADVTT